MTERAIRGNAFAPLLLVSLMMGANHVAARFAFDDGVDVATAVAFRSVVTTCLLVVLIAAQRAPLALGQRQRRFLPLVGLLVGFQSLALYAGVKRLPIVLALLAFNTYPMWASLWDRLLYQRRPEKATLLAMPVILVGLCLALDVFGAASGLGAAGQWARIGTGVTFALAAGAVFGLALVFTQHEVADVDARVRTAGTMGIAAVIALTAVALQGGPQLPHHASGWFGLAALTFLYGTAFTVMFTVLPRLGVAGNSAIMNVEPIFALVLAWLVLGQSIATTQVLGALVVVGAVVTLGLRRRPAGASGDVTGVTGDSTASETVRAASVPVD